MENIIWNKKFECMADNKKHDLQFDRLKDLVARLYKTVPHYQKSFDETGVKPKDIKKLTDLTKIPLTTDEDLAANYPFGMFAEPMKRIVRIHTSSGKTGKPKVAGYTRDDIRLWRELMARAFNCCGISRADIVQNAFSCGLITGGLGVHYGAEKAGATVIPIGNENIEQQIITLKAFGATVLCAPPSFALQIAEEIIRQDCMDQISLKTGFFGAEIWPESMRTELEIKLNITAYDTYGLTEIFGPGVAGECIEKTGLHINDDHFIAEIIDPETTTPVPTGEKGELVITTLTKAAVPLLRYRTGDITALHEEKCACSRTSIRMDRVTKTVKTAE